MVVFGGDDAGHAEGGNDGVEEGGFDSYGQVCVDSFGRWDTSARVDVNDLANSVCVDHVAGDYKIVGMPLRKKM